MKEMKDEGSFMAKYVYQCKFIRDKLRYLWKTFSLGCENILNEESHHVNFLMLKSMHHINHDIL